MEQRAHCEAVQFALSQCSFDHDTSALAFTEVCALVSKLALSVCDTVYLELALRIRALRVSA